jgi:hypothetical protein
MSWRRTKKSGVSERKKEKVKDEEYEGEKVKDGDKTKVMMMIEEERKRNVRTKITDILTVAFNCCRSVFRKMVR